jgi:predicted dehydrogenase
MAKKHLNIGLVGYKFMGKAHSNAYRQVGRFFPELEVQPVLKAICGRDEAGVSEAAQSLGWEGYETDWRKLVARDDIDIVDIATPGNSHVEIAIGAAQAGKHVFCEKPIANEASSSKLMLDAVQKAGVKHAVFFNYRKAPAVALAKQLIDQGAIGRIFHWRGTYLQDWIIDPDFPLVWRLRKDVAGSGSHGDLAAHLVDTARHLVGEITEVTGVLETFIKERPELVSSSGLTASADLSRKGPVTVDDLSLFLARFETGALGSFEATRLAPGRKNYNRFEINGSKGSLVFNMERMNELEVYTEENIAGTYGFRTIQTTSGEHPYAGHYWPTAHIIGYEHTFINFMYDALHAIATDQMPSPSFVDGYKNSLVLDAVTESSASKRWVAVP